MDTLLKTPQTGSNKILLAAMVVAALLVVGAVGFFMVIRPSSEEVAQQNMEGAVREGSPEFDALTKRIAIQNDEENTMQSPTGMGTIVMLIAGKIRNFTGKTLTGLEIKVTVVDQFDQPVKDKVVTVIPTQAETLPTNESMPVRVRIDGFKKDDDRAQIRWKVTAIKVSEK
jgi:lipopolysaccharide export LptBFGC system permease protein LptF